MRVNSPLFFKYVSFLTAIVFALMAGACDQKEAGGTPLYFMPELATKGVAFQDGSQLLITYSTKEADTLTCCYEYDREKGEWKATDGYSPIYSEEVKDVSLVEGFGQSANPPTGEIYSNQCIKDNYLRTRHLQCAAPEIRADKKVLKATMDSRAVHMVVELTGEIPENMIVTLAGEMPVKAYKEEVGGSVVYVAHLKLWHVPGIKMSDDNNSGKVVPGSLLATAEYTNKVGVKKLLQIRYSVPDDEVLVRGDQIYLIAAFKESADSLESTANVSPDWTNAGTDVQH